jgi:hypothetical protein
MRSHTVFIKRVITGGIFALLFMCPWVHGEQRDAHISSRSFFMFSAGIVTAFSIHEAAHATVAEFTGTDLDWEMGNYNQPIAFTGHVDSDSDGLALYSAGLISQVVGSEIILQSKGVDKNKAFIRGMMAWNIINPIMYSLDYWFIRRSNQRHGNRFQGDIEGVEYYSNKRTANGFALSMVGTAVFQGYRFLKTQTWAPDWVQCKAYDLSFGPQPFGGAGLKLSFYF